MTRSKDDIFPMLNATMRHVSLQLRDSGESTNPDPPAAPRQRHPSIQRRLKNLQQGADPRIHPADVNQFSARSYKVAAPSSSCRCAFPQRC